MSQLVGKVPSIKTFISVALAAALVAALPARAQNAPEILSAAKTRAASEHKNVLLVFSASWCTPCHMFEALLTDPKTGPILEKSFVVARFDVGEKKDDKKHADTPGAEALRASLGGADAGYPFLVAADPTGRVIVNSYRPVDGKPGNADTNIGYPYLRVEVDWFMEMLHRSAPSMSPRDADTIRGWLAQRGEK